MDFVLALHSHLPYVLNHGRWPHGSDWLCEAAIDTYLPLLETLRGLAADGAAAPVTIGFTPVLANQLAAPAFAAELEAYFDQRLKACDEAAATFAGTPDEHLLPLTAYWRDRLESLRALFRSVNGNLVAPFRALEEAGHIEIIGGAATHGFLPLLGRDESVRLQLVLGRAEHERLFGRAPAGCWLPECAYRARGAWAPLPGEGGPTAKERPGTEEFVAAAGFRYFFTDAHLAAAGMPLSAYDEIPMGAERFDLHGRPRRGATHVRPIEHSPYLAYRLRSRRGGPRGPRGPAAVAALVRDPVASAQVWSRHEGYPGDGTYLEFHKIRWPGGLKLWRVTGNGVDLGEKESYDPAAARARAADHATHFVHLLARIAQAESLTDGGDVVVAPFDTELFGHWWFEGPDFLGEVYRRFTDTADVRATTASRHLRDRPPETTLELAAGSWGANGDYSMWLNDETVWTWQRLWPLENAFWDAAPAALALPGARPVLAQAARELLLAQASDWQFIISTGEVADYATRRFTLHCDDVDRLLAMLARGDLESGAALAEELRQRDDVFPDILPHIEAALASPRPRKARRARRAGAKK